MEVNGLHYKQFVYREVNWNTYEVITEKIYNDNEGYVIQRNCFLKTKRREKNIKEFNEFCYEVIKNKTRILRVFSGVLDYKYYEERGKAKNTKEN